MESALDVYPEQWGAAALFHDDNKGDYLNNVTADTNSTDMYYTWYLFGNSTPQTDTWGAGDAPDGQAEAQPTANADLAEIAKLAAQVFDERGIPGKPDLIAGLADGHAAVACPIPAERPVLAKVRVAKESPQGKPYDHKGFQTARFRPTGGVRFKKYSSSKDRPAGPIRVTPAEARATAETFIRQRGGGMPHDARLVGTIRQMVATFDLADPKATLKVHVQKAFFEYGHTVNGIPVVGGARGDSVLVGVAGDEVVRMHRQWRGVLGPAGAASPVIPALQAMGTALTNIPKVIFVRPAGYSITKIQLFYHGLPSEDAVQELTPAWGFQVDNALWVYVDAFTGEFLD